MAEMLNRYIRANDNAVGSNRKTISPQDVLAALDEIEFEFFKPRLEQELQSKQWLSLSVNVMVKACHRIQ